MQQSDSSKNFGTNTKLVIDGSDDTRNAYLRFTVGSLRGRVRTATLRVYVDTNGTKDGPKLYRAANDTWGENTITWKNQPGTTGPVLGDLGAIGTLQWVQYDVTATVNASGTYSFVFVGDGTDSVSFLSRESSTPPQLVLTVQP